jgi:hypothetical protein
MTIQITVNLSEQSLVLHQSGKSYSIIRFRAQRMAVVNKWGADAPYGQTYRPGDDNSGCPVEVVFAERRETGEIYSSELDERCPGRYWIRARILRLRGCEPELNRFDNVGIARPFRCGFGSP